MLTTVYMMLLIWDFSQSHNPQSVQNQSVQFSHSVVSDSLWPHESQHTRPPCPSPTPRVYQNSCPSSRWCHPTISSSVIPFSSCLQSFPASASFQMSQLFASGGQSIGVSALAYILPMNNQDWSPLEWTGWISLKSKGLSRVFSNTTVWAVWKGKKNRTLKDKFHRSVGAQYATGDQWRNNSRKNEGMEPKQKQHPIVDVTGDRSKVRSCKE